MIRSNKSDGSWVLYTHDGSRILGKHSTYKEALRQERAVQRSKHRRSNPHVLRMFHGDSFDTSKLDPKWMAHPQANQTYGPGIYFASDIRTACSYGSDIICADIDLEKYVHAMGDVRTYFTVSVLADILMSMNDLICAKDPDPDDGYNSMAYFVSNWEDAFKLTRSAALRISRKYMDSQIRHWANEWVDIDVSAFVAAWKMHTEYDGTFFTFTDLKTGPLTFVAVLNPDIEVSKLEKGACDDVV